MTSQVGEFSDSPLKASSIIGTKVINTEGDNLGDIREIIIDGRSGRVAYAIVAFGRFFSMGGKLFAIPFSAFEKTVTKNDLAPNRLIQDQYILNVSKPQLEAAPGFDSDHWPLMSDIKWHRTLHNYYERSPYWE
jgi:sporulation protein YlmC with PRC-barrel domain